MSYVAVDWEYSNNNGYPIPAIVAAVLNWLREFDQQPPVCDWSLKPKVITIDGQRETRERIKEEEGLNQDRWIVGLR